MAGSSSTMAILRMAEAYTARRDADRGACAFATGLPESFTAFALFPPDGAAMHARNALHRGHAAGGRPRTSEKGTTAGSRTRDFRADIMADGQRVDGAVIIRGQWRELARFVLEGLAAGLVASLVFGL